MTEGGREEGENTSSGETGGGGQKEAVSSW